MWRRYPPQPSSSAAGRKIAERTVQTAHLAGRAADEIDRVGTMGAERCYDPHPDRHRSDLQARRAGQFARA